MVSIAERIQQAVYTTVGALSPHATVQYGPDYTSIETPSGDIMVIADTIISTHTIFSADPDLLAADIGKACVPVPVILDSSGILQIEQVHSALIETIWQFENVACQIVFAPGAIGALTVDRDIYLMGIEVANGSTPPISSMVERLHVLLDPTIPNYCVSSMLLE